MRIGPQMRPEDLRSKIEEANDIVDLAAALLLFCRRHARVYREADNQEPNRIAEAELSLSAYRWFETRSEELDPDNRERILKALLEESGTSLVVRARAIAVGL